MCKTISSRNKELGAAVNVNADGLALEEPTLLLLDHLYHFWKNSLPEGKG